jgi:Rieske Fe-S protein
VNETSDKREHDCIGCPLGPNRRDFLQDAALIGVAGVLASLGLARPAAALTVTMIEALSCGKHGVSYDIPAGDGAQIDKDNEVILARWQNAVYAFNLSCPHQRTALRWNDSAKQFQCPKHKSKYMPDGELISGRATRGMDRLSIQRSGASVIVDIDTMYREDENESEWKAAVVRLT